MRSVVYTTALATALAFAAPVQAKNLCFSVNGNSQPTVKLVGVSALKKPGATSALRGTWIDGDSVWSVDGSATALASGKIAVGFTLRSVHAFYYNINLGAITDSNNLAGEYKSEADGAMSIQTLSPAPCKDFRLPGV